jgi:ferric-chelate reductase
VLGAEARERPRGITLYVKVTGDWTRAVNTLAREPGYRLSMEGKDEGLDDEEEEGLMMAQEQVSNVKVLLSGPYGGLKLDMAQYQSVLLVAGGSGVTFMLGCIEECLVRKADLKRRGRGEEGPRKVECVWVVRDMCESGDGGVGSELTFD